MGAAEWTGACLGGGQPVPSRDQGTVLVDLLETFGKNKRKSPKAKSRVFSDAPDHTTFCRRLTRASAPILRHGRGILQRDVLPSPFPQADSQGITAILYIAPSQDFSSSGRPPCLPRQKGSTPFLHLSRSYSIAAASTVTSEQGALCFANHLFYSPLVWEWKNQRCCLCSQRSRGRCTPRCFLRTPGERCAQSSGTHSAS